MLFLNMKLIISYSIERSSHFDEILVGLRVWSNHLKMSYFMCTD